MEHLTGLEWSTGLFGLAIGIVAGAVSTWFAMRDQRCVSDAEIHVALSDLVTMNDAPIVQRPVVLDAPTINPLVVRMFERWLAAEADGDRVAMHRQAIRMLNTDIDPPASRADAKARLAAMKGDPL